MATLKIAKTLAALDHARAIPLHNHKISFAGNDLGKTLGTVGDVKLTEEKLSFTMKCDEEEWARLGRLLSRVWQIPLRKKDPNVRKGDKITIRYDGREVEGTLYHIRKPYKDSEDRIYYIREEFAGIPKKQSISSKRR